MFKKRMLALFVGAVLGQVINLSYHLIEPIIARWIALPKTDFVRFAVVVSASFILYILADRFLVGRQFFRRFLSLFGWGTPFHEGLWATKLDHHYVYDISLAEITYRQEQDACIYRGWAFKRGQSEANISTEDATWQSTSFVYDAAHERYHFESTGNINVVTPPNTTSQMLPVSSVGCLMPEPSGTRMTGRAHEYSWPPGTAPSPTILFGMEMHKVTRRDLRQALGLSGLQLNRAPRNARERLAIITATLSRIS